MAPIGQIFSCLKACQIFVIQSAVLLA